MNKGLPKILFCCLLVIFNCRIIYAQQININRIKLMPNSPMQFEIIDWKNKALGYDSLVYNLDLEGEYLPMIFINNNTINYPNKSSFGLHTYVGTIYDNYSEAINLIPSIISATLCGMDKSNQNGYNWVEMSKEYFNKHNGENVYLNAPNAKSGDDWWYDTMPNVFFYQMYSLYPNIEGFQNQFISVAGRWLEAVDAMGGSSRPWNIPFMNYRAWSLLEMKGKSAGVVEPEAAGAIAWILYNAYFQTSDEKFRIGAELAMEFLNSLNTNPSYELQLSYGAYIAARMNAELNTNYNIEKIINWCFDVGSLRNWGVITGTWGNHEVNGLIGEVNGSNDYAFLMNTFEQIGALVPLVRYDDRFARSIGKWLVNTVNSLKLFYPESLSSNKQDNENWSVEYDPNSYIAYEALREEKYSQSPYATGDAIEGGWAETNLALYASSHVGILGGILDTTNIDKILKFDMLKTDYFHDDAYKSFLIYNPYDEAKTISLDLPPGTLDLYDAVSNEFLIEGVSCSAEINIDSDSAVILVFIPSGSEIKYSLNKTYADGIIIDFNSRRNVTNYPPRIKALSAVLQKIQPNATVKIFCTAEDRDDETLNYTWKINDKSVDNDSSSIIFTAPADTGKNLIHCTVRDNAGLEDSASIEITVAEAENEPPVIISIDADPRKIDLSEECTIKCSAFDVDSEILYYNWTSEFGTIQGNMNEIVWTAPNNEGNYFVFCEVEDQEGSFVKDSIEVVVRDFSKYVKGNLAAYYPFNGNAEDESGNGHHGNKYGAKGVSDRSGNSNSAYRFDGSNDYILIPNNNELNFTSSVSINFWMQIEELFDRETFQISHGSWQQRWKVSVINRDRLRWTINTDDGIYDLDSETVLQKDSLYNITVTYSGMDVEIFINGKFDAIGSWSGQLNESEHGITIAQALPNDNAYNFKGILDDIRIFDYHLSVGEISDLYDIFTSINSNAGAIPTKSKLYQNCPNPFNGTTVIKYDLSSDTDVRLEIFNLLGQKIKTIVNEYQSVGHYKIIWNGKSNYGTKVNSGIFFLRFQTNENKVLKKLIYLK